MMSVILAAAVATAAPAPQPLRTDGAPALQARATVRIIAGARITMAELPQEALVRTTQVKGPDGVERDARLVEFP